VISLFLRGFSELSIFIVSILKGKLIKGNKEAPILAKASLFFTANITEDIIDYPIVKIKRIIIIQTVTFFRNGI
jgi:hypothetical protein